MSPIAVSSASYYHCDVIVIMTSRAYGRYRYDVILIVTAFVTELATPSVIYGRTNVRTYVTDTLPRLIYRDFVAKGWISAIIHKS